MAKRTSARNGQVDWFAEEVMLVIEGVTAAGLESAAFSVEGRAKLNVFANDQVDTGFMVNSIYAAGQRKSSYAVSIGQAQAANPEPLPLPPERPPKGGAVVAVAADYAIYQEMQNSFLYRALEQEAKEVGGHLETAAKKEGLL